MSHFICYALLASQSTPMLTATATLAASVHMNAAAFRLSFGDIISIAIPLSLSCLPAICHSSLSLSITINARSTTNTHSHTHTHRYTYIQYHTHAMYKYHVCRFIGFAPQCVRPSAPAVTVVNQMLRLPVVVVVIILDVDVANDL